MIVTPRNTQIRQRQPRRVQVGGKTSTSQPEVESVTSLSEFSRTSQLPSVVRIVSGWFGDIGSGPVEADAEIYVHTVSSPRTSTSGRTNDATKTTSTVQAQVMCYSYGTESNGDLRKQSPGNGGLGKQTPEKTWRNSGRFAARTNIANSSSSPAISGVRRLVVTGRTVCLPVDGPEVIGCWFELLSEDGRGATPIASVEELVNHALGGSPAGRARRYLVRRTVFGSVESTASSITIKSGEVLRPVRLVRFPQTDGDDPSRRRKDVISVQCFDTRRGSVFLPLDQPGQFSPVSESEQDNVNNDEFPGSMPSGNSSIGIVYDSIRSIVASYRLPVTVRVVAGRLSIPDSVGLSSTSMILRLTSLSKANESADDRKSTKRNKEFEIDVNNQKETVYVMALRHAWTSGTDNAENLIAVPPEAARSLFVVAASREFHVSWLKTNEGRQLATRCDQIIADRRLRVADKANRSRQRAVHDDDDDDRRKSGLRRPMSADSGLASSALSNDDLYDEIDHIYHMIRYGASGQPIVVNNHPAAGRTLQRAKSYEDGAEKQLTAGARIEASAPDIGGHFFATRGIAANDRSCPDFRVHQSVGESPVGSRPRYQNGRTTPAFDHQSRDNRNVARPHPNFKSRRSETPVVGDWRSQVSHKSSSVTHMMYESRSRDSDLNQKQHDSSNYSSFTPITVTSCEPVTNEQHQADHESNGIAISVGMTTTVASRNLERRLSEHVGVLDRSRSSSCELETRAVNRTLPPRPKSVSCDDQRRLRHTHEDDVRASNCLEHSASVSDELDACNGNETRQTRRKQPTIVAAISQTLSSAFRRVGDRVWTKSSTFDVGQLDSKSSGDVTGEVKLRERRKSSGDQKKNKRERKTKWYWDDDDDNNNFIDDEAELFNSDIGDGRPNINFQRDNTARSRASSTSLHAAILPEGNELRHSQRWRQIEPPMMIAAGTTGRESAKLYRPHSADLFAGNRVEKTVNVVSHAEGHYVHLGQY